MKGVFVAGAVLAARAVLLASSVELWYIYVSVFGFAHTESDSKFRQKL